MSARGLSVLMNTVDLRLSSGIQHSVVSLHTCSRASQSVTLQYHKPPHMVRYSRVHALRCACNLRALPT